MRVPSDPGVNDSEDNLTRVCRLSGWRSCPFAMSSCFPYNTLAGSKYASVGRSYDPGFDETRPPNIDCAPFTARGIRCQVL